MIVSTPEKVARATPTHGDEPVAVLAPAARSKVGRPLWAFLGGLVMLTIAGYIYVPRVYYVTTDDAYVQADIVSVTARAAAYVSRLHIDDNSAFKAGDLLVELDPRDFQLALDIAEADLASAQAAKANIEAQILEQTDVIAAAKAAVDGDQAAFDFAQQQLLRYAQLMRNGAGTIQRSQQAQSDSAASRATLQRDTAALTAARDQSNVLNSQIVQAEATIKRQTAAASLAMLNLSYTRIFAPTDGTVANRTVQAGNYVQPGQTLVAAVPANVFVVANIKESELSGLREGQTVEISVDSLPGTTLRGHIDGLQRGTGSTFALLPPENATGNFVKVVQRVPVKITLDGSQADLKPLTPGMSVEARVSIHEPPPWLAWFIASLSM